MHGAVENIKIQSGNSEDQEIKKEIQIGEWESAISSPIWLKSRNLKKPITITFSKNEFNIRSLYEKEIKWVENPQPNKASVVAIIDENGHEERHLIQKTLLKFRFG